MSEEYINDIQEVPVITIDGPSGTGKGTICHLLAKHLSWHFLDSGAIYRVLALSARRHRIDFNAIEQLTACCAGLNFYFELNEDNKAEVFLDGENCGLDIRSELCAQDASILGAIPEVRTALLARQREFARAPGLVTDGRDMGTVVFPNAIIKLYLDATLEERAKRRFLQLKKQGNNDSLAQVTDELLKRDTRDTAREHAPLKAAVDAVNVDTTGRSIDQVFLTVLRLVHERLGFIE